MNGNEVLTLRLTLMGRPVRSFTFDKPVITVGRDPDADVFIDNPGVSREHVRLERRDDGNYMVVDLGSANGSMLNEQPIRNRDFLNEGDALRIGKYTMTVNYGADPRKQEVVRGPSPDTDQHTVVLSRQDLDKVHDSQLKAESQPPAPPLPVLKAGQSPEVIEAARREGQRAAVAFAIVGFLLGAVGGASTVWFVLH